MTDDDARPDPSAAPWAPPGHELRAADAPAPADRSGPADPYRPVHPRQPAQPHPSAAASAAPWPGSGGAAPGAAQPFAVSGSHRESVLAGPGYSSPAYRNDQAAVASLVLGLVGVVVPAVCLFAVLLGHIGLRRLRTSYRGGRGLAVAGLVLGYLMTAVWLAVLVLQLVLNSL
ncbi:DUF4190 domain-containing protein [Georgenia sp. MJ170]|uniref:DUF4190 domain-containing protein n=1 Tax=Georgenia sunbinii TaxID=3117728 RepID=UPI002F268023